MPIVDIIIESKIRVSDRVKQVSSLFDVPLTDKCRLCWSGDVPIDGDDWQIGLIVGPSGSGKSTIARELFKEKYHVDFDWGDAAVIDDCSPNESIHAVAAAFSSVGFNTIPAWMRTFGQLSNGEKFRVDLARRLLEIPDLIVVDEFTSVVDRQVAKIGSHAVQKHIRKTNKKFVAISCHDDVIDWLQPDWVLSLPTMDFRRRLLRQRPTIPVEIRKVDRSYWSQFAPFHYLTADAHPAATFFCLFVDARPACIAVILHFPHPRRNDIKRVSRLVTLPDFQGLGLAFVLVEKLGAMFKDLGYELRTYPSHPTLARNFSKNILWQQTTELGTARIASRRTSTSVGGFGESLCAVFRYTGDKFGDPQKSRSTLQTEKRSA
jgi:ABC-type uncharacterized transport system YnjBCD ATPase subunit/GNAT superfamily N-acetyltransferase